MNEIMLRHEVSEIRKRGPILDIALAKSALRAYAHGKKLRQALISELYLGGYIRICLQSPRKALLPTVITEKGNLLLEA